MGIDFSDHLTRLLLIKRSDAESRIGQRFGKNTAEAEHNHRAELGIPEQSDNKFPAALNKRRNEASFPVFACGCFDGMKGLADFFG